MSNIQPDQTLTRATSEAILISRQLGFPISDADGGALALPEDPILAEHLKLAMEYLGKPVGVESFHIYNAGVERDA